MQKQIQNLIGQLRKTDDPKEQNKIKLKIDELEELLFNEK